MKYKFSIGATSFLPDGDAFMPSENDKIFTETAVFEFCVEEIIRSCPHAVCSCEGFSKVNGEIVRDHRPDCANGKGNSVALKEKISKLIMSTARFYKDFNK